MPDLTMCSNSTCPLRDGCYRYRAVPAKNQSRAMFKPVDGACHYRVPIRDESRVRLTVDVDEEARR